MRQRGQVTGQPPDRPTEPTRDATDWWRRAVVYQVYIRSFAAGDGDGVGDIAGTRARLPYLRDLGIADRYEGGRILLGEVGVDDPVRLVEYLRPDALHAAFNFGFMASPWSVTSFRSIIDATLEAHRVVGAPSSWVLSNHDAMRHVTRFGRASTERRHREPVGPVESDLELGTRRARAAILLMLALPGCTYLFQGEELGLPEVLDLPPEVLDDPIWSRSGHTIRGRDGCRVPLPWAGDEPPFDFGPEGSRPWLPQP